ncbi:gliding motility protein GldL [Algoriphagus aestuariicola]|jgi:gliding motility-associated protein GldL|uniref:Gliding motility protein GldL n=1 Tax=Algoriphagus aestuariicola TaxID=1852016 RepID=A0ABS3BTT3_9BACT|nr:gliding motility protein GldL [Algoriphagus aestuariicola]
MASNSNSFKAKFYSNIMPKIYGIGAAVVILGAMFKILDWQFANVMIGVGLTTEAIIFFLSSFEPRQEEMDWSKIYPELADNAPKKSKGDDVSAKLDEMLSKAKIGPELIDSLGKGMQNLATSAQNMGNLSDAALATNEYATNVKSAAKTLVDMNASYGKTAAALTEMSAASQDAKAYHTQVVNVTKNLTALNAVYEMELQDANSHVKTLNKFYSNMSAAMQGLSEAGKETEAFKNELAKLNQNVSSLNKIYGGMLSAMKG